jgi:hypothetical protein
MKVFLSYSFGPRDKELVRDLERLLSSLNLLVSTGKVLGGGQLTDEVKRRIDSCEGLVALMTRREQMGDPAKNLWTTHQWVRDEYGYAVARGTPAIALVEDGVDTGGMYGAFEWKPLDRAQPLQAFLDLAETLREWKEQAGVQRVVQIRPDHLGSEFKTKAGMKCRYRFVSGGVRSEWVEAEPVLQASGTLLYLRGVQDDDTLVEVEILKDQTPVWWSPATSQFISVEMKAWEAAL